MASFLDFAAALTGPRQYFAGRLEEQDEARKRAEQLAVLRELGLLGEPNPAAPGVAPPTSVAPAPVAAGRPAALAPRNLGGGQDYAADAVENPLVDLQPFRRQAVERLLAPREAQTFPYTPPAPLGQPRPINDGGAAVPAASGRMSGLSQEQYLRLLPVLGAGDADKLNEFLLRRNLLSSPEFQDMPLGRQANLALGDAKPTFDVKDHQLVDLWSGTLGAQTGRGASLSAADRALAGQRQAIGARSAASGQIMARDADGNDVAVTPVTRPDGSVAYLPAAVPQGFSIPPPSPAAPKGGGPAASGSKPVDIARQLKDARAHAKDMVGADRWAALTEQERRAETDRYRRELYPGSEGAEDGEAGRVFEWNGQAFRVGMEIPGPDGQTYRVIGQYPDGEPEVEEVR